MEFFKCLSNSAGLDSECVFSLHCVLCTDHVNNSYLVLNSSPRLSEQIMPLWLPKKQGCSFHKYFQSTFYICRTLDKEAPRFCLVSNFESSIRSATEKLLKSMNHLGNTNQHWNGNVKIKLGLRYLWDPLNHKRQPGPYASFLFKWKMNGRYIALNVNCIYWAFFENCYR